MRPPLVTPPWVLSAVSLPGDTDLAVSLCLRRVRNQARPLTGDKADKLGAVVREVQEAATHSGDAYSLFTALGFTIEYHFSRKGSRYRGRRYSRLCVWQPWIMP